VNTRSVLSACILLALVAMPLIGQEEYVYPSDKPLVSMTFPSNWKVSTEEQLLHAMPPDESVYLGLWFVHEAAELDAALEEVDNLTKELLGSLTLGETKKATLNGMPVEYIEGEGVSKEGDKVMVDVALFNPQQGTVGIAIYFGTVEADKKWDKQLTEIINSIKPFK
jgi:hypothetical protein